jgi:hypothetical protein
MKNISALLCFLGLSTAAFAEETPWFPESPNSIGIDRIVGDNNLEHIEEALNTDFYEMARSVARVEMSGGYCTGFRVGEDLMMTNNHCYNCAPSNC